jgi:hypothetical protein
VLTGVRGAIQRTSTRAKFGWYRVVPVATNTHSDETPPRVTTGQLHLDLELEFDRDPIEGCVSDEHGRTTSFIGWLELIALVEKALMKASMHGLDENELPLARDE